MLLVLRRGLPVPGSAPSARLDFVRGHAGLWRGAWILWHAAAVSLVLLFLVLAERFRRRAPVRAALAMIVAVAGLAADLAAEAILMAVPPAFDERGFEAAEVAAGVLTGYLANGLYTAAGLLLTWAGARQLAWPILLVSVPV